MGGGPPLPYPASGKSSFKANSIPQCMCSYSTDVASRIARGTSNVDDCRSGSAYADDRLATQPDDPSNAVKSTEKSTRDDKMALIVEDSQLCRQMLKMVLKKLGYKAEEAEDGQLAVNMLKDQSKRYDLILCDNVMPNMNGPNAVKEIRALGYTGLIVGVTGNMLPDDVADFIAHGANLVLGKPLRMDALKKAIEEHQHRTTGAKDAMGAPSIVGATADNVAAIEQLIGVGRSPDPTAVADAKDAGR